MRRKSVVAAAMPLVLLPNGSATTDDNRKDAAGSIVRFNESIVRAGLNFRFSPW